MRKSSCALVLVLVLLAVAAAVVYILIQQRQSEPPPDEGPLSFRVAKPKPIVDYFEGCPPSGSGGDPALNTLKNRIDEGAWTSTTISALLALDWPAAIEHQPRSRWSRTNAVAIARYEGTPVQVEGYLLSAKKMSPETCNCRSVEHVDFHIWLADHPSKSRAESIVIEVTPRVLAYHPEWALSNLQALARKREKVRISGWLMMDPEHPDQVGRTRASIWEIHPIMQIETRVLGVWAPLDSGTTGFSSAPAIAETAPPVTPVGTATQPPESDRSVQDNSNVRITTIFFDGTGRNEPDEYVVITNSGSEPVDITDWELQDVSGSREYKWESYVLKAGESIRVYTNEVHPETGGFTFGSSSALWRNAGDLAELRDADYELVSRYAYGDRR